ncbi:MAG: hypothetical protein R2854_15080 [Caldilineaceae bacterium]
MRQPRFEVDILNNLKWLIGGVVPTVIIAIFLAYFLELTSFPKIEAYIRTLILYPVAMSFIVTGTVWSWMYEPGRGVINSVLRSLGFDANFAFATNPTTATYWLILIFVWQYLGFAVIIVQSSLCTQRDAGTSGARRWWTAYGCVFSSRSSSPTSAPAC